MPTFLPVGPTTYVENSGYTPFERTQWLPRTTTDRPRSVKRRTRRNSPPEEEKEAENKHERYESRSKDDLDLDFSGISNMMRGMTFKKSRKWRHKSDTDEVVRVARPAPTKAWVDVKEEDDDNDDVEINTTAPRRPRSSAFIKYRYPKEYHQARGSVDDENVPQCLRHYPRYTNLPRRQSCGYDPFRSVTKLKVHSVRSSNLPHPNSNASKAKQRPMSAPASYNSAKNTRPGMATSNGTAANNNGVYHVIYEEKRTITETVDLADRIVMKDEYSDEEPDESPRVMQDTIISLENFEDEDDGRAKDHQQPQKLPRPSSPEPHFKDPIESSDEMYDIKFESDPESLLDETEVNNRPKTARSVSRSKNISDAEEVDSDY